MDKKNTMLLTVIAVATLLVAVVGATFAYFSIVQQPEGGSTSATKFQGTTEGVDKDTFGTASLTDSKDEFYITLSAADMSQGNAGESGKDYYATTTPNDGLTTNKETEVGNAFHTVATAVINGGKADKKIRCTSTATITPSGTLKTYVEGNDGYSTDKKVVAEDGAITFRNIQAQSTDANHVYFYKSTETITDKKDSIEFDLLSVLKEATTFNIVYDITTATSESEAPSVIGQAGFEAALKIVNRNANQNYLADKNLTLQVDNTKFVCSAVDNF